MVKGRCSSSGKQGVSLSQRLHGPLHVFGEIYRRTRLSRGSGTISGITCWDSYVRAVATLLVTE